MGAINFSNKNSFLNHRAAKNQNGDFVFFTLDDKLQAAAEKIVRDNHAAHVALIAMDPRTGKILALAEKSSTINDLILHAGFPAASLFKVVTTAAAIDSGKMSGLEKVSFRGGTYELSERNYLPNAKTDKRSMTIGEALGKSCNPVFGRVALNSLNAKMLEKYGRSFGFMSKMPFELDLPQSNMDIPSAGYALSRTAAGFGDVNISPLHAVTLMSGLVNGGLANRPILIDKIISPSGEIKYRSEKESWLRLVPPATASQLVNLMINTTTIGTSRKEFFLKKKSVLGKVRVAGKTGTLKGDNPVGLNNWFIGAPVDNPTIAVAAIVVDPGGISTKASRMGRMLIQKALE
jgi:cell division protein FtsI/penicillin-binding protein 2